MGTGFVCAILIIICFIAVRSYMKKLAHGCCGSNGDSIKKVKVKDREKSHYRYKKQVQIDGMMCQNCSNRIENAFHTLEGYYAKVDLSKGQLTLLCKQDISDEKIKRIVKKAGYLATDIISGRNE